MRHPNLLLATLPSVLLACGDDLPREPEPAPPATLVWEPCAHAVIASEIAPGTPSPECASLRVPLTNADPAAEQIEVGVRRYTGVGSSGHLWYLEGGPGGTGLNMEADDAVPFLIGQGWDVYIPIHRGLKGSTPLRCPDGETPSSPDGVLVGAMEAQACGETLTAEWGQGLEAFNADEQAHDLASLLAIESADAASVALWGTSYGTFRALKFLEHYPDSEIVDSVVIDSVLDLQSDPWNDSVYADAAALPIFVQACIDDPSCAEHTADDPEGLARRALARLEAEDCPALAEFSRQDVQYVLTSLAEIRLGHAFIFPLLDRIDQCTSESADQAAFALRVLAELGDVIGNSQTLSVNSDHRDFLGELLYMNVSCRDLHRLENTTAEILERDGDLVFSRDEPAFLNELCATWPTYRDTARPTSIAATSTPLLIVAGQLDFPTPPQWASRAAEIYASAQFVPLRAAGHGAFDQSGASIAPEAGVCLFDLLGDFLSDPSVPVDAGACAALSNEVDVSGTSAEVLEVAAALFAGPLWFSN